MLEMPPEKQLGRKFEKVTGRDRHEDHDAQEKHEPNGVSVIERDAVIPGYPNS